MLKYFLIGGIMDNFDKFTELINYIEANLDADIEPKKWHKSYVLTNTLCIEFLLF